MDVSEIWYEKMMFWIPQNMLHFFGYEKIRYSESLWICFPKKNLRKPQILIDLLPQFRGAATVHGAGTPITRLIIAFSFGMTVMVRGAKGWAWRRGARGVLLYLLILEGMNI